MRIIQNRSLRESKMRALRELKERSIKISEIRDYVRRGMATDITDWDYKDVLDLNLETVGISLGTYGMNGGLFQSADDGEFYAVLKRNALLFRLS